MTLTESGTACPKTKSTGNQPTLAESYRRSVLFGSSMAWFVPKSSTSHLRLPLNDLNQPGTTHQLARSAPERETGNSMRPQLQTPAMQQPARRLSMPNYAGRRHDRCRPHPPQYSTLQSP
ncbi:hypothetical protein CBL_11786 [Carabus blaptoides fortunei]